MDQKIICRLYSQYNSRFNDIVVDHSFSDKADSAKFDIVGNKYKLKHSCSACFAPQEVEVIKLAYHRGCVVIKCPGCLKYDLFSDKMKYFKTEHYEKELSMFHTSKFVDQFKKFDEKNVIQIAQLNFAKKAAVKSSRMAGFWEDSAWDDKKALF